QFPSIACFPKELTLPRPAENIRIRKPPDITCTGYSQIHPCPARPSIDVDRVVHVTDIHGTRRTAPHGHCPWIKLKVDPGFLPDDTDHRSAKGFQVVRIFLAVDQKPEIIRIGAVHFPDLEASSVDF